MSNKILIGVGVVAAAAGVAYYFYNKNKNEQMLIDSSFAPSPNILPTASIPTATGTPTAAIVPTQAKQSMWKDRDGDIYQITAEHGNLGYVFKINGSKNKTLLEHMWLGPDGQMYGVNLNGSVLKFESKAWSYAVEKNKAKASEFLLQNGQPDIFAKALSGLGSAFILN